MFPRVPRLSVAGYVVKKIGALTAIILATTLAIPAMAAETPGELVRVSSYKGSTLEVGDRSGFIIGNRPQIRLHRRGCDPVRQHHLLLYVCRNPQQCQLLCISE